MGHIGVDESGKGDYFGYLVIAAAYADEKSGKKLQELGVRDSKQIADLKAQKMAASIKKICPHDIIKISPEKYNILYKKFGNLNRLLAWGHAKSIENLLKKTKPDFVLTDQFGDEKFVREALLKKGIRVKLIQRTGAESDIAVAAASVLARAEFLRTLRQLSLQVGRVLPKGATHVEEAAREMIAKYGEEVLDGIAKRHFKTTKKVTGKK